MKTKECLNINKQGGELLINEFIKLNEICPVCEGIGKLKAIKCTSCNGDGFVNKHRRDSSVQYR